MLNNAWGPPNVILQFTFLKIVIKITPPHFCLDDGEMNRYVRVLFYFIFKLSGETSAVN